MGETTHIWVFPKIGVPQNGWFKMENPIKIDDLRVPLFSETSMYIPSVFLFETHFHPRGFCLETLAPWLFDIYFFRSRASCGSKLRLIIETCKSRWRFPSFEIEIIGESGWNTILESSLSRCWFISGWWQLTYFLFSPRTLGKISNLTHIFQMGGSTTN